MPGVPTSAPISFGAIGCGLTRRSRPAGDQPRAWRASAFVAGVIALLLLAGVADPLLAKGTPPDWARLQESVVSLEVYRPGEATPSPAVGFFLAGAEGIITSHRLVRGAERVVCRPAGGSRTEITRYLAHDLATDLILLDAAVSKPGLARGSDEMLALGQVAFALLPQTGGAPVRETQFMSRFQGAVVGECLAVFPGPPTGAPYVDSLGQAIGMIEVLKVGATTATCVVPIRCISALLSRPDPGGRLADLAAEGDALWLREDTGEGLQTLGAVLCRGRRFTEGMPLLTQALERNPNLVEAFLEWGMAFQIQSEQTKAEEKYRKALALRPKDPVANLYLGSCLHMQGLYLKAEEAYQTAIDADPEWSRVYVNMGGIYFLQGKKDEAERAFRQAIRLDPDMGLARYNLGVLLNNQGRQQDAFAELDYLHQRKSGFASQLERFTGPWQANRIVKPGWPEVPRGK